MKGGIIALTLVSLAMLVSCGSGAGTSDNMEGGDTLTSHSQLLTLVDHGSWTEATIQNPWDSTAILARYALVRDDATTPQGYTPIKVPVATAAVFASVYGNAIIELGAGQSLKAAADAQYCTGELKKKIQNGEIRDIGPAMSPSIEALAEISPDIILQSPYHNAGHGEEARLGIPIVEMADYMEDRPLGRAEWILLLGELYGRRKEAQGIFQKVKNDYTALQDKAAKAAETRRPVVLTEKAYSGVWNVPGGSSYAGNMIWDAGGRLPWQNDGVHGSSVWDYEKVLSQGQNADIWLLRIFGPFSLRSLSQESGMYTHFKAYKGGHVYHSDTSQSTIFDDVAFHPERVLAEYIRLLHPEVTQGEQLQYYQKTPLQ